VASSGFAEESVSVDFLAGRVSSSPRSWAEGWMWKILRRRGFLWRWRSIGVTEMAKVRMKINIER
jgi:hypothetical protein